MTTAPAPPAYVLQQIRDDLEPSAPGLFVLVNGYHRGVTGRIDGATTWPTMVEALEAAPGPGWRVVDKAQVLREAMGQ